MTPPPLGLYVHFPWCVRKCPYCDFNSHPLEGRGAAPAAEYLAALLADFERERERFGARRIDTVFCGGGTPSLFEPGAFAALLRRVPDAAEATLEANPGAVEHGDFRAYRSAGITRVSLGAQSFDAAQLRGLGRIHGADDIRRAARAVADAGFDSFNLDIMHGLPGQTPDAALADLEQAIGLDAPHISWYQLTVEPKTAFAARPPAGLPDGDLAAEIEEAGVELLARHGYRRYEVSAYARPGHRCAHNLNYWRFGDYIGIGAGAHGKLTAADGTVLRTAKPSQPRLYLQDAQGTTRAVPPAELPGEFLMNALRLAEGVGAGLFEERTGLGFERIAAAWSELADWGLAQRGRLALTAAGYRQLNGVVQRFL